MLGKFASAPAIKHWRETRRTLPDQYGNLWNTVQEEFYETRHRCRLWKRFGQQTLPVRTSYHREQFSHSVVLSIAKSVALSTAETEFSALSD